MPLPTTFAADSSRGKGQWYSGVSAPSIAGDYYYNKSPRQVNYVNGDYVTQASVKIAVDSVGNVYTSMSIQNSVTLFLTKFDVNGTFVWQQQINLGAGAVTNTEVAVDSNNNVIVAFAGNATNSNYGIFIYKYNSSGTLLWINNYQPVGYNTAPILGRMRIGANDSIYIGGALASSSQSGYNHPVLIAINSSGTNTKNATWDTHIAPDFVRDFVITSTGKTFVLTDQKPYTLFELDANWTLTSTGVGSVLTSVKTYTLSANTGGADKITCLAVDSGDNIWIGGIGNYAGAVTGFGMKWDGTSLSSGAPVISATFSYGNSTNGYNPTANGLQQSPTGQFYNSPTRMVVDNQNNVYQIGGWAAPTGSGGGSSTFVVAYTSNGSVLSGYPISTASNNTSSSGYVYDIALDSSLNLYVGGRYPQSTSNITNKNGDVTGTNVYQNALYWKYPNPTAQAASVAMGTPIVGSNTLYTDGTSWGMTWWWGFSSYSGSTVAALGANNSSAWSDQTYIGYITSAPYNTNTSTSNTFTKRLI